jgi:L-ribulose-5-phosphate 3-epimerase
MILTSVIGCTTVGYLRFPLERALDGIAGAGLHHIDLAAIPDYCEHVDANDLDPARLDALRAELDRRELTVTSISGHTNLTGEPGRAHVEACIRLAARIGATYVVTGTGAASDAEAAERLLANVKALAALCEDLGVLLALETQDDVLTSGTAASEFLAAVGSPAVGLNLDAANVVYWSGRRPEDEIAALAPHVIHTHVKDTAGGFGDYEFRPIGEGDLDFRLLFDALADAGFDGPLMIEPETADDVSLRDPAQVEEARRDPGSAYRSHSYLGTDDAVLVDDQLARSIAVVRELQGERVA